MVLSSRPKGRAVCGPQWRNRGNQPSLPQLDGTISLSRHDSFARTYISTRPEILPRSLDSGLQKTPPSARDDNFNKPVSRLRIVAVYHMYIMASASGVLYTGITNHLERRVAEHKQKLRDGFTKEYDITRLVYFEPFD
jgi:hypothetical protein